MNTFIDTFNHAFINAHINHIMIIIVYISFRSLGILKVS